MNFLYFKNAVNIQFETMASSKEMFVTDVDKDDIWDTYLKSFPEGSNPIFRERTDHDCQCCKTFIRGAGNVVTINNDFELESIWDIQIGGNYQVVADALSKLVKSKAIKGIFRYFQRDIGTDHNYESAPVNDVDRLRWDHFHFCLPNKFVHKGDGNPLTKSYEEMILLARGLNDISISTVSTTMELIDNGSIYRGKEQKPLLKNFKKLQEEKEHILSLDVDYDMWLWEISTVIGKAGRIRNTAIGTLLIDIGAEMDLDQAVFRFNKKMSPENYKRPTSVITKGMVKKAQDKINELGYIETLDRRPAVMEDITINNVLFANRDAKKTMNVFDELAEEIPVKKLDKLEEIHVDKFIADILPTCTNIELMLENNHQSNLMSLVAPVNPDSKTMFKWGNNFSWTYNGSMADSIKEKVKRAGGDVQGDIRCSLSWFNSDDLDIHCTQPRSTVEIYYANRGRRHASSGMLDVDMNAGGPTNHIDPVENITFLDRKKMVTGTYKLFVRQFQKRGTAKPGFDFEIEMDNIVYIFSYPKIVTRDVMVADIKVHSNRKIEIVPILKPSMASKEIWGINTQQFHKVKLIMNSPNHWDGERTGNKHLFFVLEGCKSEEPVRGFFNEFLKEELTEHRKVFEVLGSKMVVDPTDGQLSGVGFSSTRRASVICKVTGAFTRTLKINF